MPYYTSVYLHAIKIYSSEWQNNENIFEEETASNDFKVPGFSKPDSKRKFSF